jgi:hypothetical protein
MTIESDLYGQGSCAVCGGSIRKGLLMCRADWARVPDGLRRRVYQVLDAFQCDSGTLGDLREAQEAAVAAVRSLV